MEDKAAARATIQLKDFSTANLGDFDVVIALDPEWGMLSDEHLGAVRPWVKKGGGLIVVAGSQHSPALVAKGKEAERLEPVRDLLPVALHPTRGFQVLKDNKPRRLNFPKGVDVEFLRLRADSTSARADWDEFFTGQRDPAKAQAADVREGFYSYYPAASVRKGATVLASLSDPAAKLEDGQEQPWLVSLGEEDGKVLWFAGGETWRLRLWSEEAYERLWLGTLRHMRAKSK
jgi:hypothetical protein